MLRYIMAHWRGKLSLGLSLLVNGIVLYVVFIALLVRLGGYINLRVGLALFLAYLGWAFVGIFRCGLRVAFREDAALWRRALGIGAIVVSLAGGIARLHDLRHPLFSLPSQGDAQQTLLLIGLADLLQA